MAVSAAAQQKALLSRVLALPVAKRLVRGPPGPQTQRVLSYRTGSFYASISFPLPYRCSPTALQKESLFLPDLHLTRSHFPFREFSAAKPGLLGFTRAEGIVCGCGRDSDEKEPFETREIRLKGENSLQLQLTNKVARLRNRNGRPRAAVPAEGIHRGNRRQESSKGFPKEETMARGTGRRVGRGERRRKPGPSKIVREVPDLANGSVRTEAHDSEFPDFGDLLKEWRHGHLDTEAVQDAPFMDAVVKVYCTHTEPNYSLPWQKRRQSHSTGSGFMIAGRRLLTNAHCVDHHTQVKVKRRGDDTKFVARVLSVGVECDIALLAVDDEAFWENAAPLRFGGLPCLQDAVTVVGYPIGGDTISVTSGVVSRIEVMSYVHGSTELLGVQIDAAINPGNSGGPTFNDAGECVGIAFQGYNSSDAENIGYIIPTPVIFHFLEDFNRNGRYTGFPTVGVYWQVLESPAMRASLRMGPDRKGVFVCRIEPTAPAHGVLRAGDVLLRFDGVPVANDGTVPFRKGERVSYKFLVSQKYSGETARLDILRDGQEEQLDVMLEPSKRLIPVHIGGRPPSYFIAAGFVFTPVVEPFLLSEYGQEYEYDTPVDLLQKLLHGTAQHKDEEVVVLCQVLANDCSLGYEMVRNAVVKSVNGTPVRNLRQLASAVDSCTEEFLRFEVGSSQLVVLETRKLRPATQQVLAEHSIPHDRSEDLRGEAASTAATPPQYSQQDVPAEVVELETQPQSAGSKPTTERTSKRARLTPQSKVAP